MPRFRERSDSGRRLDVSRRTSSKKPSLLPSRRSAHGIARVPPGARGRGGPSRRPCVVSCWRTLDLSLNLIRETGVRHHVRLGRLFPPLSVPMAPIRRFARSPSKRLRSSNNGRARRSNRRIGDRPLASRSTSSSSERSRSSSGTPSVNRLLMWQPSCAFPAKACTTAFVGCGAPCADRSGRWRTDLFH